MGACLLSPVFGNRYPHDSWSGSEQGSASLGHGAGVLYQGLGSDKTDGGNPLGHGLGCHWFSLHKSPVGSQSYHFCGNKTIGLTGGSTKKKKKKDESINSLSL